MKIEAKVTIDINFEDISIEEIKEDEEFKKTGTSIEDFFSSALYEDMKDLLDDIVIDNLKVECVIKE